MTLASQTQSKIKKVTEGKTFGYAELCIDKEKYQNADKALEHQETYHSKITKY